LRLLNRSPPESPHWHTLRWGERERIKAAALWQTQEEDMQQPPPPPPSESEGADWPPLHAQPQSKPKQNHSTKAKKEEGERKVAEAETTPPRKMTARTSIINARPTALPLPPPPPALHLHQSQWTSCTRSSALNVPLVLLTEIMFLWLRSSGTRWPLFFSPSPGALGAYSAGSDVVAPSVPTQAPGAESLLVCIEKFLLCEHKNSANVLLYLVSLALFVSDTANKRLPPPFAPLVPPTSRINRTFKALVAAGLALKLIFELKNVQSSVWVRSVSGHGGSRAASVNNDRDSGADSLYRLNGSALSPVPLSQQITPTHIASTSSNTVSAAPSSASSPSPMLRSASSHTGAAKSVSNLTPIDRQLECVGAGCIMLAMNVLILKRFIAPVVERSTDVPQTAIAASTAAVAAAGKAPSSLLSPTTVNRLYLAANVIGFAATVRNLIVALFAARAAQRARLRNNASSADDNSVSAAPHRSLPLLLPSFSYIELIHALLDAGARSRFEVAADSSLSASMKVLRVMAVLSSFYWSAARLCMARTLTRREADSPHSTFALFVVFVPRAFPSCFSGACTTRSRTATARARAHSRAAQAKEGAAPPPTAASSASASLRRASCVATATWPTTCASSLASSSSRDCSHKRSRRKANPLPRPRLRPRPRQFECAASAKRHRIPLSHCSHFLLPFARMFPVQFSRLQMAPIS
jgi:hypothetical protein